MTTVLNAESLLEKIPLHRSTIWRLEREGRFPRHIQLSPRRVGWLESDVAAWLETKKQGRERLEDLCEQVEIVEAGHE